MNVSKYKYFALLQLVVLIFGFTAILGKLILLNSYQIVWYRMLIASIGIFLFLIIRGRSYKISIKGLFKSLGIGVIIATHWILFFEAIKQSNVSITLASLSSASMFTAFIEPIFFKRKIYIYEVILGILVMVGLFFIFQFEGDKWFGILLAVLSALLASLFTVLNGRMIKKYTSNLISLYELLGGFVAISIYFILTNSISIEAFEMRFSDLLYLLILGIICTAFAFVASVEVMKELTPFTVSLSINLEPIYGIILAYLFFGEEEKMSFGFYLGASLILLSIALNMIVKKYKSGKFKKSIRA